MIENKAINFDVSWNMEMDSNYLKIDPDLKSLKFQIKKDSGLNFFHIFMLSLLTIGHMIIALFIFNSIRNDGIIAIKVAFVIFGLFGLWTVNKQLREILIFIKGNEVIEIDDNSVHYNGKFGIFKKTLSLKLNEIKRIELTPLGVDKFSQSSNMFTQMKYGMIVLEKSRRKKIAFGQSLDKQDLETLFTEIEKKIKLPTMAKKS